MPADLETFTCAEFGCKLTRRACGKRHLRARMDGTVVGEAGTGGSQSFPFLGMRTCAACPVGEANAVGVSTRLRTVPSPLVRRFHENEPRDGDRIGGFVFRGFTGERTPSSIRIARAECVSCGRRDERAWSRAAWAERAKCKACVGREVARQKREAGMPKVGEQVGPLVVLEIIGDYEKSRAPVRARCAECGREHRRVFSRYEWALKRDCGPKCSAWLPYSERVSAQEAAHAAQ